MQAAPNEAGEQAGCERVAGADRVDHGHVAAGPAEGRPGAPVRRRALCAAGDDDERRAEPAPPAGDLVHTELRVEPFEVLAARLDDVRAAHASLHQLDASLAPSDHRGPDIRVVADQHAAARPEVGDEVGDALGARRSPGGYRAEMQQLRPRVSSRSSAAVHCQSAVPSMSNSYVTSPPSSTEAVATVLRSGARGAAWRSTPSAAAVLRSRCP